MVLDEKVVVAVIDALWGIFALYWLAHAFGNKRSVYEQGMRSRVIYMVGMAAAVEGVMFIARRERWMLAPVVPVNVLTQGLGIGLCAAGIGIAIWARRILGRNWSGWVTVKEGHELIRRGPYAVVRHPIYSGLLLGVLGSMLALFPSVLGGMLLLVLGVGLRLKSLEEERVMDETFGEAYGVYRRELRALVPFLY